MRSAVACFNGRPTLAREELFLFVVHAAWLWDAATPEHGRLGVWAEDSSAPATPPRRPGRAARVRPHPFAATHEELAGLLGSGAIKATTSATTLTLPMQGGGPVASPELVRDFIGDARGAVTAAAWQVPVLEFDADQAVVVLACLDLPDTVAGASLTHLAEVARFALDLAARGRVLPALETDGAAAGGPHAVWRPVLTGPDVSWSRSLAVSMPPPVTAAASGARLSVWADALDSLVDAAVRAAPAPSKPDLRGVRDPAARAWLAALTGFDRGFAADPTAVTALATAIEDWQRDAVAGPVRACFRLVEPAEDDLWQLRFALQATDEPSLVVDADAVWRSRGKLKALARHVDSPHETFLAELGRASRLYPDLDDALRTPRPAGLPLDAEAAHTFLRTIAPALATAGFGVLLPGWWTRPSSRLGLRLAASTPGQPGRVETGAVLGFEALVEFRYQLAVGDEVLTDAELAELADLKAPLVRLRGQWVELDAKRLAAGLKLVGRTAQTTVGELLRLGLGLGSGDGPDELPVEGVAADGWLGDLLSGRAEQRLAAVEVPDSFDGQLRPYQERGLAWLDFLQRVGLGGVLADDMGLGKTVQLLALLAHHAGTDPTLLVCPMSLVGNWQREAARFAPELRVHVHHGAERARGRHFTDAVAAPIWSSPPTRSPPGTPPSCARSPGTGSSSTRRRRSRTPRPGRRWRSARCPQRRGSRSPARRSRTGWPTCGRSWSSPTRGCSVRRRRSRSATPSRSSGTATTTPRSGCAASPDRSSCAASRPTSRSSPTCRRSSRWRCSATSPPSRPRSTRRSSTTCSNASRPPTASSAAASCSPR